jgi:diguanylate cyclase (GGDEF)-like protein
VIESANGLRRIVNASGQSFFDSQGKSLGAVVAMHDITDQKKIELELLAKQALLRSITDSIPVGVAYVDKNQRYQYCNQQYHRIYNLPQTAIVGRTKIDVFGLTVYKTLEPFINGALSGEMVAFERQLLVNDKLFHLDVRFIPDLTVTHEVRGFYVVVWNMTEQKNRELEYKRQASMDPLTGVYNKSFIIELLKQEIKKNKETNQSIAIMFLDIDYFKRINDNYGHLIGDEIIKFFAAKVRSVIRETDHIGRFGGDEFLLVLPDIRQLASVEKIAEKILVAIQMPFKIGALTFQLSTSIGIAFSQRSTCVDLIKLADEAVYEAKAAGRGNYKSKQSE